MATSNTRAPTSSQGGMDYSQSDTIDGSGRNRAILYTHDDGSHSYGTYKGTIKKTSKPDGSWEIVYEGTYQYVGGSGKYKNIKGGGTYKGRSSSQNPGFRERGSGDYRILTRALCPSSTQCSHEPRVVDSVVAISALLIHFVQVHVVAFGKMCHPAPVRAHSGATLPVSAASGQIPTSTTSAFVCRCTKAVAVRSTSATAPLLSWK